MRPALTPIQTCVRKPATQPPNSLDINTKILKRLGPTYGEGLAATASSGIVKKSNTTVCFRAIVYGTVELGDTQQTVTK